MEVVGSLMGDIDVNIFIPLSITVDGEKVNIQYSWLCLTTYVPLPLAR